MTEISEAAKVKASELYDYYRNDEGLTVLARFIQEVSDAAKEIDRFLDEKVGAANYPGSIRADLAPFILPDPVDPLAEVLWGMDLAQAVNGAEKTAEVIRQALAKRGLEIRKTDA